MTCKNNEWEPKICPYCKYDICSVRYRHNLKPENVVALDFKINIILSRPLTEVFADKLKEEFGGLLLKCIMDNNLITPHVVYIESKKIMKE